MQMNFVSSIPLDLILFFVLFFLVLFTFFFYYTIHTGQKGGGHVSSRLWPCGPPVLLFLLIPPHRFFCFFRVMFLLSITSIRHGRFFSSPQSFDRPVFFRGGWPPIHRVRRYSAYGGIIKTTTTECPLILYPYNKTKNSNSFALEIQK
jgi:hypothetical protein